VSVPEVVSLVLVVGTLLVYVMIETMIFTWNSLFGDD
jgi:hypothetical protein